MKTEDLTYRTVDGKPLLGRLYRPEKGGEALVVEVHGGAWIQNDRTANAVLHEDLARNGCAVFALDFRMAPAYKYPAAIEDVNYGIRWIKANAAKLGLKPRLFGGLGTSSGGQQLFTAALLPGKYRGQDDLPPGVDARLDFLIGCWPILDPLARFAMAKEKGLKNLIDAHNAFWPSEAAMAEGNPQRIVERGEAQHKPPVILLQGTADANVEHERADRFAAAYRAAGGKVELHKFEGQAHTFAVKEPTTPASVDAMAKTAAFVRAQLAAGASPQR